MYYSVYISYPYKLCWNSERNNVPLNVTGPIIEGVASTDTAHLKLIDGDPTTCLSVPFTASRPHSVMIYMSGQTLHTTTHTFSVEVRGLNLLCRHRRTIVYATDSPLPEQLGVPRHTWKKNPFHMCTLQSSVTSGTEVCTFACDCGTFCSGIYVSTLSKKSNFSTTTTLCEISI